ncbi:MAG: DNA-binding response regulator [Bacteroidetes bacterium]|nr:MAG: DNA-binding response regulator [Bacteroidota bacterium]
MLKALMIDDEPDALEALHLTLMDVCPQVAVAGKFTDARRGLEAIRSSEPDLVFLDIEMPRMNGFQLLEELGEVRFSLIFTTAYSHFAVKAFKFSAVDYLLKPVSPEELQAAVGKAIQKKQTEKTQLELLRRQLYAPDQKRFDKIALPYAHGYTFVELAHVLYCESDSSYTRFYLASGEVYLITKTLGNVEEMLEGGDFFRLHKQFLVNMRQISRYVRGDGGYVLMPNGVSIPVSRSRKEEFVELFTRF